jgi:HAD superfamily hydrolase (TIGR01509 family)
VFDLSFDRVFQSWATASGRQFADIKNKFVFDELSDKFERNEISAKQFRTTVSQRLNMELSNEEFDKCWCDLYLDAYNDIDNLLVRLKRNNKLVALTNTNSIHDKVWRVKYANTLQHFEKIFCSHEIGTRKPEEKSFTIVLDYLQCKPSEAIFLDDNADNINGAHELGIATILVTSQMQMRDELLNIGLLN